MACYVTGKTEGLGSYYFGSEAHVVLALTQEAFAVFILRAQGDNMHNQIMSDLREQAGKIEALAKTVDATPVNTDERIEARMRYAIACDKLSNLVTQKAESGVRILRQIKKEYEQTGKLVA